MKTKKQKVLLYSMLLTLLLAGCNFHPEDSEEVPPPENPGGSLPAPTGVSASVQSDGSIRVSWNSVSEATEYIVSRSTGSSGTYTNNIGSANSPTLSFTDEGVNTGTTYYYKVTAVNNNGVESPQSSASGPATATGSSTSLSAPTGLTATAQSNGSITVTWSSVSGAAGYTVYRSGSATGTYTSIGTPSSSPYSDTDVSPGTTYYYKVSANNSSGGQSPQSSYTSATALGSSNPGTVTVINNSTYAGERITAIHITGTTTYSRTGLAIQKDESYTIETPLPPGHYTIKINAVYNNDEDYYETSFSLYAGENVTFIFDGLYLLSY